MTYEKWGQQFMLSTGEVISLDRREQKKLSELCRGKPLEEVSPYIIELFELWIINNECKTYPIRLTGHRWEEYLQAKEHLNKIQNQETTTYVLEPYY